MRSFLLKAKHFFKRNIYPITVTVCTALVLGIVTISAYTSIKKSNNDVVLETNNKPQKVEQTTGGGTVGDTVTETGTKQPEESKPISTPTAIIFDLPFANAIISKEYTDSSLLYDATTKLWCTHQGLDFACISGQEALAVYDGKIEKIENSMMNGTTVYLKIADNLVVIYKGLSSDVKVKEGDIVKKGQVIGQVVSFIAEKADGVHLHLEMTKAGKLIDPTEYFAFNK